MVNNAHIEKNLKDAQRKTNEFFENFEDYALYFALSITHFLSEVFRCYKPEEHNKEFYNGLSSILLILEKLLSQVYKDMEV